ncbi:hypothetical protein [Rurimicrobium arvi]|uniref:RRM domain-containing protein n=1 Tax=Rurimicrobium arvi TaxID=2049916 RepID=A0ABP8MYF7_9BACT
MRLYVENLPEALDERELYCLFIVFGGITEVTICRDKNGKSLGSAYVDMPEMEQGKNAVRALNEINFMNHFLRVWEIDHGFLQ